MGKSQKRKGYEGEREFASLIPGAKRVPLSGALGGEYSNDVTLPNGWAVEVKRRKEGAFKTLYGWIEDEREKPDVVAMRADRKQWIVCMTLPKFLELLGDNE